MKKEQLTKFEDNSNLEPENIGGFLQDVIKGLRSHPKKLYSKYFYDAEGDHIFQRIMRSADYYVTDCELEIFKNRCSDFSKLFSRFSEGFDVVELGAGDAYKSRHLLKCLLDEGLDFTYYPTDISEHAVNMVSDELPEKLTGLKIKGLTGEFFDTLDEVSRLSGKPKVVLFLGSNIGNMPPTEAVDFCRTLRKYLSDGDLALIGFDLKKNPWTIFKAYNDSERITKEFNLNLLNRINKELNGNFNLEQFDHYENYDPESGACKSYLFSLKDQKVTIQGTEIHFAANEIIYMETSQKYTEDEIEKIARETHFKIETHLYDSKKWFIDSVWEAIPYQI
ncbi:L-histidine N(alpha)-methyltransferase [Rubrolithibacter danxiaensis]|uniref:L-histidine N(alpha)-methyltransferase n=1 Tax=Rubrolithibacter danxiaensis TaxID=3390805 RepID=UPI003BF7F6DC